MRTTERRAGAQRLHALLLPWAVGTMLGVVPGSGADRLSAQAGWNDTRCLELVGLGRQRRQEPMADSLLTSYRAEAEGFVYFLLDPEDAKEPILLRSDQVALELNWAAPDRVRQVVLGMRSREQLPIRDFHYYLDRFTVIQNGFGDEIVVGGGQDVHSVVHPLAPRGPATYEYRLADSIALRLPGRMEPVKVYEVQVRPRDPGRPGFVGSLFLERARGDLVRLAFTFTPSSYIDPRNERVEIVLENGLWEGRYWLPHEQRLLVRREVPELDVGVGTVIRAVLAVRDYQFNGGHPGSPSEAHVAVVRVRSGGRESYPFANDLLSGLEAAGIASLAAPGVLPDLDYGKLMAAAAALPGSGLPPLRLFLPGASSVLRFNRSEGVVTGLGLSYRPGSTTVSALAGYGWGDGRPRLDVQARPGDGATRVRAFLNRSRDLSPGPAEAGLLSSFAAATLAADYLDPYLVSGIEATHTVRAAGGALSIDLSVEEQRPASLIHGVAPLQTGRALRPVLAGESGTMALARTGYDRDLPMPVHLTARASVELEAGVWHGHAFGRASSRLQMDWSGRAGNVGAALTGSGGAVFGDVAPQHLYFLGGRGTLPGSPFRAFVGDQFLLIKGDLWHTLPSQLLSLRLLAGAGWTGLDDRTSLPKTIPDSGSWRPTASAGVRTYWGLGVAVFDRLLHLDYVVPAHRGVGHGHWLVSIDPRLHALL